MPTDIVAKTQCTLSVLTDVFSRYGFTLNFSLRKTEVMLEIRGTGARNIRAEVFSHKDTMLTFSVAGRDCNVEVSHAYKHLGTLMSAKASMAPEVTTRVKSTRVLTRLYRANILTARGVEVDTKRGVHETLMWNRLLYNVGTWNPLSGPLFGEAQYAILRCRIGNSRGETH